MGFKVYSLPLKVTTTLNELGVSFITRLNRYSQDTDVIYKKIPRVPPRDWESDT